MTPATSYCYVWHPIANNIRFSYVKNFLYLIYDFYSPFQRRVYICLLDMASALSHLTSSAPPKSNSYFDVPFATGMREPALCRLLTFHITNLMSIFIALSRLFQESVQIQGRIQHFSTSIFSLWGVNNTTPNPQVIVTTLVNSSRLLIHYTRSLLPYLEAASSIYNVKTRCAVVTNGPPITVF
jgi:hypothetical protein